VLLINGHTAATGGDIISFSHLGRQAGQVGNKGFMRGAFLCIVYSMILYMHENDDDARCPCMVTSNIDIEHRSDAIRTGATIVY
jgi:hypothetical protein